MKGADGLWYLKVRVAAVPEKGRANDSLLALLARELHIPTSSLTIASGTTSRLKTIVASGGTDAVIAKLTALGDSK